LARQKHGDKHPEYATAISWLANVYGAQGRYAEAERLYKRSLAIREKALGPEDPLVANSLNSLADLYRYAGRFAEAELLLKRALAMSEKALGLEHSEVATTLNILGALYRNQGRYAEAEPLYKRALAIRVKAFGEHSDVATSLNNLAQLYAAQGRYAEAEPLYKRSLAIREKALGPEHSDVAYVLNNLAELYRDQSRYAEAEPLSKRSLAISEKALGPKHPDVADSLNNLAEIYRNQGRYAEAEPLYRRSLAIREKALGLEHRHLAQSLNNLAVLYQAQGRYTDAEPLLKRALAILEKALGPEHPHVANALSNLAANAQGRFDGAEPLYKRALAIYEKAFGAEHPDVGTSVNNLASLYRQQGRYAEAEPLAKRGLAIREKAFGPEHRQVAQSLNNLGSLYLLQGRYSEAEPFYKRCLAIREKTLGAEHPFVGIALNGLALIAVAQRNWAQAAEYWRRATLVIEHRAELGLAGFEESSGWQAIRDRSYFSGLIRMTDRLSPQGNTNRVQQGRETFKNAQWAHASEAARSLALMSVRSAKGDTALAGLVRERQDLIAEWQAKDKQLLAARSKPPLTRNPDAEKLLSDRLTAIDARLAAIDARFTKDFQEYVSLTSPKPASVAEVQPLLEQNEALVLFLDTDTPDFAPAMSEETLIWVVTKSDMRWAKNELGTKALRERVAALRCGLDATLWNEVEGANKCKALVGASPRSEMVTIGGKDESIEVLPFDPGRAHELYQALLGPVADMIEGKRLIVVPSGPLTSLPFNVLVTEEPKTGIPERLIQYRDVAWLASRTAITVLPAVSSLKALRQLAKRSRATKPYLGIGNPLLDGPQDEPVWGSYYKKQADLARSKRCSLPQHVASAHAPRTVRSIASLFRGVRVDIEQIRYQVALPETADELCQVARGLGVPESEILLGTDATEGRLKDLSEHGRLADYAVVHFATHGVLTGQMRGSAEPGLILTPPPKGTSDPNALERDDGFLTASEIAALKLDADWVILSACNTAGAQGEGAEALSGMARAFFYAGARALLLSHWEVGSDAAVKLTTGAFAELRAHPEIGRAEAFRLSMKELIEKGNSTEAHPSQWAPFVVVGEGAASK
jgi:CHAT domain-containing protein/tetratricopeptide (TPR) repeat protein